MRNSRLYILPIGVANLCIYLFRMLIFICWYRQTIL